MNRFLIVVTALALWAVAAVGFAADTNTVTVSADVVGTCRFNAPTTTLAFGTLNQNLPGNATVSGGLSFWCTRNTTYTLSDPVDSDGSYAGTLTSGTDTMAYSLTYDNFSGSGQGRSTAITSTLTATILNSVYVDAPAGNYSETVLFTINP